MALPLALQAAGRATMPLWRLLGRGRYNPFRPGGQPTYRGQPFPEGATTTGVRSPSLSTPGGTTYNPQTGGYGTVSGGATRGAPYVNRPLMDPRLYNAARTGALNPQAHPWRFGGAALGTAAAIPFLMGGEEEQGLPMGMAQGPQAESSPFGLPTATERAEGERSEYLAGVQDIIARSGIISTIDKKAGQKYRENMFDILTTTSAYNKNVELAKISDAALSKEGTPREIYHRMIKAGATAEEAAVASGHQVDIARAEQTSMGAKAQVWDSIMQTLMAGNVDSAALMLVQAWGTGQLGGAPITENFEQRLETARLHLTGIMEGETAATAPGAGSGITDISLS